MYHFIGIKGAGMSSLAVILKQLGYSVKGSDLDKHFFTEEELIKNNIEFTPYNKENITEGLTIIKGLSITDDNIELIEAKRLNLEIIDYNEMVGRLTRKFKTICICGCHGKTTTTAMIAHTLKELIGINYLIGDGTGYANQTNEYFALESCEYRRHFLSYTPYYAVVLNIDLDHVDYFKDIKDVIDAYTEFANSATKLIIACGDDENVRKMHPNKEIFYFGLHNNNDLYATNIDYQSTGTTFDVYVNDSFFGHFNLPIYGTHQLLDALAVISVCYHENIKKEDINKHLSSFTGAKRRFTETIVGNNVIIDDYAHHPNEIKSTINAIKQKYPNKLIISIFQPHTFSRTKEFASDIAGVLSTTDEAYIMDIHPAREKQSDFSDITKDIIINKMNNGHPITINDADILNKYDNAVFIFMSPNDVSHLENTLINLKKTKESPLVK